MVAHYIFTNPIPLLSRGSSMKTYTPFANIFLQYGIFVFIYTVLPTGYVYIYLNYLVGEGLHEYSTNKHEKNEALTILSVEIAVY